MNDGNLEIPIKVVFDDSNVEKDMSSLATKAEESLRRIGSDKTMGELDKSIQKAFQSGVAGADKLLQKFAKNKMAVMSYAGSLLKLEKEYHSLAAARKEAFENASKLSEENMARLSIANPQGRKEVEAYRSAQMYAKEMERQRVAAELTVQAAQAKLEIENKLRSYYAEQTKFMEKQEQVARQRAQFNMRSTEELKAIGSKYGFKSDYDITTKGYNANGTKTAQLKAYEKEMEAALERIAKEEEKIQDPIPSEKLEQLSSELMSVAATFRTHMEQVHSGFSTEPEIEQIRLLKAELDNLSKGYVRGNFVTGNRYMDPKALDVVDKAREKEEEANQILNANREVLQDTMDEYALQDGALQEINDKISDNIQKQSIYKDTIDATTRTMQKQADSAEGAKPGFFGAPVGDESSLKKIFSWQRVFTIMGRAVQELGRSVQQLGNYAKQALISIGKLAVNLAKISTKAVISGISKIAKGVLNIRKNIAASLPSMRKVMKFLMKYVLGFRSIYFLARKIRSAITEGFKAMAMVDESVNKSISSMLTALNQLKGQIGASFAPLLNTVAPIIVEIINLATQAAVAIGAFLATLTGQHTFKVAVAEQVDYAESLKGTASAAKDAAKAIDEYLSPLDELNRMDAPDDGKKGGGGGAGAGNDLGVTYKEVDVKELGISDFAEKLKTAWKQQNWAGVGQVISEELDNAVIKPLTEKLSWENISEKIIKFNKITTGIINGFFAVEETFKDGGTLIGTAITTALKTVNDFVGRLDFEQIGKDFAIAIKAAVDEIDPQDVATYFTDKFMVVFDTLNGFLSKMVKDGTFEEIASKIAKSINGIDWYGIFTSIFTFGSLIGHAFIDAITGFLNGGGFTNMLNEIARAINDSASNLSPSQFAEAAHTIGAALVSILTDVNTFLGDTKGSFDTLLEGIGTFITELPWEDIFKNSGEIVSKILNAIVGVLDKLAGSMNEIQSNGKSLATNIGIALGEGLANIDFTQMGEAFGLFGEAIIDGIKGAIEGSGGVTEIITALVKGFNNADASDMEVLAGAAIWLTVAGKIVEGIGRALPLVLSANQALPGGIFGTLANVLGTSAGAGAGAGASGGFAALAASMSAALPIIGIVIAALTLIVGGLLTFTTAVEDTRTIIQETYDEYLAPIMENIQEGWDYLCENVQEMYDQFIAPTVDNIATQFNDLWDNHLKSMFEGVAEWIGNLITIISILWKTWLAPLINFVIQIIAPMVSWVIGHIVTLVTGLAKIIASHVAIVIDLLNMVADVLIGLTTGDFTKFYEDCGKLVDDVGALFKSLAEFVVYNLYDMLNGWVTGLNSLGNGIEDFVNGALSGVNDVLEAAGKPTIGKFDLPSVPSIPYPALAKGAVIPANQPFLAQLGDQRYGRNLEAPEGLIRQIMREELGSAGGAGNNTYHVQATIQRRVLFDTIIDEAKLRQQASGANPFDLM